MRYAAVTAESAWRNPHLSVTAEGFYLRTLSSPVPRRMELGHLRQALVELPVGDWPYGRVVVLQQPSIMPGGADWYTAMKKNFDGALMVLRALDAHWWAWPG